MINLGLENELDDSSYSPPVAADDLLPSDRALYEKIAQGSRQAQFLNIYSYDPESARRYYRYCCEGKTYTAQDDLELILKVLPTKEWAALSMAQLRLRLERLDPYYNKSALGRNLERLCQEGRVFKYVKRPFYLYWKSES